MKKHLQERYLYDGNWETLVKRVSKAASSVEKYDNDIWYDKFYSIMIDKASGNNCCKRSVWDDHPRLLSKITLSCVYHSPIYARIALHMRASVPSRSLIKALWVSGAVLWARLVPATMAGKLLVEDA